MNFQIGDKVVCVDDKPNNHPLLARKHDPISRGTVYAVREVVASSAASNGFFFKMPHGFGIRLIGIYGGTYISGDEGVWSPVRFRKLDELKAESRERYYATQTTPQP